MLELSGLERFAGLGGGFSSVGALGVHCKIFVIGNDGE